MVCLDGERVGEGIDVVFGFLTLADLKRAAREGVFVAIVSLRLGLASLLVLLFSSFETPRETGRQVEVSSLSAFFARFVGWTTEFPPSRFGVPVDLGVLFSGSLRHAVELVLLSDLAGVWTRPGWVRYAEGCPAMESIFLNSAMCAWLKRPALPFACAIFRPPSKLSASPSFLSCSFFPRTICALILAASSLTLSISFRASELSWDSSEAKVKSTFGKAI